MVPYTSSRNWFCSNTPLTYINDPKNVNKCGIRDNPVLETKGRDSKFFSIFSCNGGNLLVKQNNNINSFLQITCVDLVTTRHQFIYLNWRLFHQVRYVNCFSHLPYIFLFDSKHVSYTSNKLSIVSTTSCFFLWLFTPSYRKPLR